MLIFQFHSAIKVSIIRRSDCSVMFRPLSILFRLSA